MDRYSKRIIRGLKQMPPRYYIAISPPSGTLCLHPTDALAVNGAKSIATRKFGHLDQSHILEIWEQGAETGVISMTHARDNRPGCYWVDITKQQIKNKE